jgi:ornithine carbamoyltransferase|tara:strand:+ start:10708 stop:11625 length:918 start_codon:yes stop_codon:yes gene_type:complete
MNLLSILDIHPEFSELLKSASKLKSDLKSGRLQEILKNQNLAMIFDKPSTRTRISFEVAMSQLGGHAIYLDPSSMHLKRGESIKDTATTLSKYVNAVVIRTSNHKVLVDFAKYSEVPVINGLTDLEHPCQALSDLLTIKEHHKKFPRLKLAYIGDGNNVCNSLLLGASMAGLEMSTATPKGYEPKKSILKKADEISDKTRSRIQVHNDPLAAVEGADIIYTDVWVSMGHEKELDNRINDFKNYQVNTNLVKLANNPLIMHCLPAKRGQEITSEVIESKNSIVFEQAENRLHLQKALLCYLLCGDQ